MESCYEGKDLLSYTLCSIYQSHSSVHVISYGLYIMYVVIFSVSMQTLSMSSVLQLHTTLN